MCTVYGFFVLCVWYMCIFSGQCMCSMYLLYICGILVALMWFMRGECLSLLRVYCLWSVRVCVVPKPLCIMYVYGICGRCV